MKQADVILATTAESNFNVAYKTQNPESKILSGFFYYRSEMNVITCRLTLQSFIFQNGSKQSLREQWKTEQVCITKPLKESSLLAACVLPLNFMFNDLDRNCTSLDDVCLTLVV